MRVFAAPYQQQSKFFLFPFLKLKVVSNCYTYNNFGQWPKITLKAEFKSFIFIFFGLWILNKWEIKEYSLLGFSNSSSNLFSLFLIFLSNRTRTRTSQSITTLKSQKIDKIRNPNAVGNCNETGTETLEFKLINQMNRNKQTELRERNQRDPQTNKD